MVAVKWYRPALAGPLQHKALDELIGKGEPSGAFLWPLDFVTKPESSSFGYIMPLRDPRFVSMSELMRRNVDPDARVLATTGYSLAEAFLSLHTQGLCYRDISFSNIFFDPGSGDVLICDNDNVAVDGSALGRILGTPRFMAPEVVRGEALPSSRTDLFSLAILLFNIFFIHHPFEGAREQHHKIFDIAAMRAIYGERPVFIFDPDDNSNRPVPGHHQNALDLWPYYPKFFRELFIRAFTHGVADPDNGRVRESQWRKAMIRLRDSVLQCDACGGDAESFWDPLEPWSSISCWRCGKAFTPPLYLEFETAARLLALPGARLWPHHLTDAALYDFSKVIGDIVRHPSKPSVIGIHNASGVTWHMIKTDGSTQDVVPDASVQLVPGTTIDFGASRAKVRVAA
jgi:DNA-binding helix-hairpin-helix protein with protein kinase domain